MEVELRSSRDVKAKGLQPGRKSERESARTLSHFFFGLDFLVAEAFAAKQTQTQPSLSRPIHHQHQQQYRPAYRLGSLLLSLELMEL